jgi:hypothetical protein
MLHAHPSGFLFVRNLAAAGAVTTGTRVAANLSGQPVDLSHDSVEDIMSEASPFDLVAYLRANPYKGPFVPKMHIVWEGDSVQYYAYDVPCYTEQIDANLWVHRAVDSHEVVGVTVHGLKAALDGQKRATGPLVCCLRMMEEINHQCLVHASPFDCPDSLVKYSEKFQEYGLIIHDGGASCILIHFCPWCGAKLPEPLRESTFDSGE